MAWNSSFPLRFINIAHQYYSPNCTFLFRHMHSQIIFLFISVMFIKIIRNLIPIIAFILLFSWDVAGKPEWTSLGKVSIINFYITSSDGIMFVLVVTMSESFTWIFQHIVDTECVDGEAAGNESQSIIEIDQILCH